MGEAQAQQAGCWLQALMLGLLGRLRAEATELVLRLQLPRLRSALQES